tara:strand:+ start:871 stop:1383 length:513 start_codon:yes stop_codon:yes gene_type:complete
MSSVDYGLITESTTINVVAGAQTDTTKIFKNIRMAFETQFNTAASQASITNKVFENTDFDAASFAKNSATTEILRGTLLPAATEISTLGSTGTDLNTGIFQIDYYCRVGIGGFTDKLDTIANQFPKSVPISAGGTTVNINSVSLGVGRREGAFFVRNLDVSYFAVTAARS